MKPTVAACLIVKDEAESIRRCLDAARPLIDSLVVCDTGSTDGTPEVLREWAIENLVTLHLKHTAWENFKVNRTDLMQFAADKADWLLLLDADMEPQWRSDEPWPPPLDIAGDSLQGHIDFAGLDYTLPLVVRAGLPWFYEGVRHSYLACSREFDENVLEHLWIIDHSHTTVEKLEGDLVALSEEVAKNPLDRRSVFYLAQTYYDLDRFPEAIHYYRMRADMGGWDEEVYFARYRLGCLLVEHVDFGEGAIELLRAWKERPSRAEALRALAGSANSVADKIPYPTDRLFVGARSYAAQTPPRAALRPEDVSAVLVTRGDVDLAPILETLPFEDVVIWDNSKREQDLKTFGRYMAMAEAQNDIVAFVDDDVLFDRWDQLLALYQPGRIVANMDPPWIEACGYQDMVMMGAGSITDRDVPAAAIALYLEHYPFDAEFLMESCFVVGTLAPGMQVDLGYTAREFADSPDRLYTQPWQWDAKARVRAKARAIRDGTELPPATCAACDGEGMEHGCVFCGRGVRGVQGGSPGLVGVPA